MVWFRYWNSTIGDVWDKCWETRPRNERGTIVYATTETFNLGVLAASMASEWVNFLAYGNAGVSDKLAGAVASYLGLNDEDPVARGYGQLEVLSIGILGSIVLKTLAPETDDPADKLLGLACRSAILPGCSKDHFDKCVREYPDENDRLWVSLARHICGCSMPEDQDVLNDAAKHPDTRTSLLNWGLKYIVRGDLVLDDGQEIRLDDLADDLNLPRLPYLEDMPNDVY